MKKNNKKFVASLSSLALVLSASTAISCSSKKTFFNYKSYFHPDYIDELSHQYDYKAFDSINEFTQDIKLNKASAGIGSDMQATQLIKQNLLQKIDYLDIFWPENEEKPSWAKDKKLNEYINSPEYRKYQESLFTAQVNEHLKSYDNWLATNVLETKDKKEVHLVDYFVPYFSQDMVVAYNPKKIKSKLNLDSLSDDLYQYDKLIIDEILQQQKNTKTSQTQINKLDLISILKGLRNKGYERWALTNSVRDSMVYGSTFIETSVNPLTGEKEYTSEHLSGEASTENNKDLYKVWLNAYSNLIKTGIGHSFNSKNIYLSGDGLEIVNKLVDPNEAPQAAILYNGDAIDAYFANDNDSRALDRNIRFLRPSGNLLLVDGLIISAHEDQQTYQNIIRDARKYIYGGLQKNEQEHSWLNIDSEIVEKYAYYHNYDNVGYTSAYQCAFDYIKENYFNFDDEESKEIDDKTKAYEQYYAQNLYAIGSESTIIDPLSKNNSLYEYKVHHVKMSPIEQIVETNINTYWNELISS